ncbi:MAG TPA: hypothetical protein VGG34_10520 [Opitutaceae bacterium]|jgi:hypothetical protein
MVSEPTVLVVGAGGSAPYGYPSGSALVDEIVNGLSGTGAPLFVLLKRPGFNFSDADLSGFRDSLFQSRRYSIDLFLEKHPEYMEVGKAAIAGALIPREQNQVRSSDPTLDWYRYLFDRLARNRNLNLKERLTILTFNYDRSLDHYLYQAFMHAYKLTSAETYSIFDELVILHLHGSLCTLPWQTKPPNDIPRPYGENAPGNSARQSAQGIRIIHELDPDDSTFQKAHAALATARRVLFLGFGYEPTNVHRLLGKDNWLEAAPLVNVHGTGYGLTQSEASDVKLMFKNRLQISGSKDDCLSLLRNSTALLS